MNHDIGTYMRPLLVVCLLIANIAAYGEDAKALDDKCVEMLIGIEKSMESEKALSDDDKAFKEANLLLIKRIREGSDVELKYRFIRFQMLAVVNSNGIGMRSYERNKKDLTEPFYLQMKKQVEGAKKAISVLDELHGK